jgi:hypothetical protein
MKEALSKRPLQIQDPQIASAGTRSHVVNDRSKRHKGAANIDAFQTLKEASITPYPSSFLVLGLPLSYSRIGNV